MKHALITGASSGIGKEIAKYYSQKGWSVTLLARNQERLESLSKSLPNSNLIVCDLSQPKAIEVCKEDILARPMDVLINNAGIFAPESVDNDHDNTWERHFQSNLMSAVRLTRLCWPSLKKQKGSVLNISSTLGMRPIVNAGAYSALKAAMNNWTQTLALEGAPHGIRANALCPGIIDTPIHSYMDSSKPADKEVYQAVQKAQPLGRTGKPADIAAMAFHFGQPEAQWITGSLLNIDGGILLNS